MAHVHPPCLYLNLSLSITTVPTPHTHDMTCRLSEAHEHVSVVEALVEVRSPFPSTLPAADGHEI